MTVKVLSFSPIETWCDYKDVHKLEDCEGFFIIMTTNDIFKIPKSSVKDMKITD